MLGTIFRSIHRVSHVQNAADTENSVLINDIGGGGWGKPAASDEDASIINSGVRPIPARK